MLDDRGDRSSYLIVCIQYASALVISQILPGNILQRQRCLFFCDSLAIFWYRSYTRWKVVASLSCKYIYIYMFNWTSYVLVALKYSSNLSLLYGVYLYSCTPCFILCGKCTEVGKVTFKSNNDEALSNESLQKSNGEEALNDDSL
jgi:hypothetical protein